MRFIKQRPSGVDKDIPVFEFAFGSVEIDLFLGILKTAKNNLPSCDYEKPAKNRLKNIIKGFENVLREYKSKK